MFRFSKFFHQRFHTNSTRSGNKITKYCRKVNGTNSAPTTSSLPVSWTSVQIEKTNENFHLIYDIKGHFAVHRITTQEAKHKLCKVTEIKTSPKNVPYLYTSIGRDRRLSIFYSSKWRKRIEKSGTFRKYSENLIMGSLKFQAILS